MKNIKMNKRVAILLPNLAGGGAERISANLANSLAMRGYDVDMVLLSATGPYLQLLRPDVRVINLQVSRMRSALLPLVRYLHKNRPNAMLACMWPLTVFAVVSQRIARVATKIVVAEHITWSIEQSRYCIWQRLLIRTSMRLLFPGAKAIVTVSNGARDDFAKFSGIERSSISMIYNPVVHPLRTQSEEVVVSILPEWKSTPFRVLTVGNLKEQKNHELLLRAFAIVLKKLDAHLLILGEGPLRPKLEILINELGIKDNVSMPGFVGDPTAHYQTANLFALSSDWEGLPTVLIEALACGTPVVSTDCPSGPREILCDGQFGRLVPVGDVAALAEAMTESLASSHDCSLLKARALHFSVDRAVDQYEALLCMD